MKNIKYLFLILTLLMIISCGSSSESEEEVEPILTSIDITSSNGIELDLQGVKTTVLSVLGKDQFGNSIAISGQVSWSVNNNTVNVHSNGAVEALIVGSATITALVENISMSIVITVVDSRPEPGTYIYVSDAGNFDTGPWKIIRYDEDGNNPQSFITENLAWPQDILFLENENQVLISNLNTGVINRHNAITGSFISVFASGIAGPTRMKLGPDNLLYVLQWSGNGKVLRYQLDGTLVDEFTSVGVNQSIGLDWDKNNNLYVSSFQDANIRKFDTSGNDVGLFVTSSILGPTNIWFDNNDNLFVNDWTGDKVVKYNSNGSFIENFISSGIDQPEGVEFLSNGHILIGSGGTKEVKVYDTNGNFVNNLFQPGAGGILRPNAIRVRIIH